MIWRLVPALLAVVCLLAPASADARWRTGDGRDMISELEVCRDGMKFVLARWSSQPFSNHDHGSHTVPSNTGGQEIVEHLTVTTPSGVVYDQHNLTLPYSPVDLVGVIDGEFVHRDLHRTFTIKWSQPLTPGVVASVDFDDEPDGANVYPVTVGNCYLSTATNGKIAFASNRDGNFEIYTMNSDGSAPTRLTSNTATDNRPAWSPDGSKIAYISTIGGDFEIYTMKADGSAQTPITSNTAVDAVPTWSPDGTEIAFYSNRDGNFEIYKMNADGTGLPTRLTSNLADDTEPEWSPDGTQIAFSTNREGAADSEIYRMNANGSNQVRANLDNSTHDLDPYWSTDGSQIAFTHYGPSLSAPEIHAISGLEYELTGDPLAGDNSANDPRAVAWGPDGTKIAFAATGDGDQEIYTTVPGLAVTVASPIGAPPAPSAKLTSNFVDDINPDWQPVYPAYPRPKGATPTVASLVPAYAPCTSANRTHGPPLAHPSCYPADTSKLRSSYLTVGTIDANGAAANSVGLARFVVVPGNPTTTTDEADVKLNVSITDVRCRQVSTGCTGALADYTGQVLVSTALRLTDRLNGPTRTLPGTEIDLVFPYAAGCAATADTTVGSTCSVNTSADAVTPGIVPELKRSIWQLDQIEVYDGGSDGVASTLPNTLFARQGVFVP